MSITVAESTKLVERFAGKVFRRCRAAGAKSIQLADITQELWIAWCKARDTFDPSQGVPFGAYLQRGMMNHINRYAGFEIEQSNSAPYSLDQPVGGEENATLGMFIEDRNTVAADDAVFNRQAVDLVLKKASPVTRRLLEFLLEPPEEMIQEFEALKARSKFARERGFYGSEARSVRISFVADFMGLDTAQKQEVMQELAHLAQIGDRLNTPRSLRK